MSAEQWLVILSLCTNVVSSIGIIFVNKELVFGKAGFHFGCVLTVIHFLATFGGCLACFYLGYVNHKHLRLRSVVLISFAFCGYVVFNNLSLLHNSVTVYQMSKIMGTPVIASIEYKKYRRPLNKLTISALILICFGSTFTVGTDTTLTLKGLIFCVLAILSNSFYTVWGKSMQVDLKVSPLQLLMYQAPMSAAILVVCCPGLDDMRELFSYQVTWQTVGCIGLSCLLAFCVNFSFFVFCRKNVGPYNERCWLSKDLPRFCDLLLSQHNGSNTSKHHRLDYNSSGLGTLYKKQNCANSC
eukprot:gene6000-4305_t